MTPDLKTLALAWAAANDRHDEQAIMDRIEASEALYAALTLPVILALIDAAQPAPGEFGERLRELFDVGRQYGDAQANSMDRPGHLAADGDALIASLVRDHAALVAERDALRADAKIMRAALERISAGNDTIDDPENDVRWRAAQADNALAALAKGP